MLCIKIHQSIFNLKNNFVLLTFIIIAVSLLVTDFLINEDITTRTYEHLYRKATDVAHIIAKSPVVIDGLSARGDAKKIQDFTEIIADINDIRFVVVMNMDRVRQSHPDPMEIGTYYDNPDANTAFSGQEQSARSVGSLGESLRVFVPVYADSGEQIGVVLVGIMLDEAELDISASQTPLIWGSLCGLLIGIIGAIFLARHIKKSTFGLEPFAIARLLEERNAILAAIREGAFAIDKDARIRTINATAIKLFADAGISTDAIGQKVEEFMPNTRMHKVLKSGIAELDQEQNLNGLTILTNRIPVYVDNEIVGVVATFRDKSELQKLAEKVMDISTYADALRAQTHEFMNKLHVVLGMIQLQCYDQLQDYIRQIAYKYQFETGSIIKTIKDPVLAGFLLGKLSWAHEAGVEMTLTEDSAVPDAIDAAIVHDIITILGNLLNNAVEAVEESAVKNIQLKIVQGDTIQIEIHDTGKGIDSSMAKNIYENGYSTKKNNSGIGLYQARQSLNRLQGTITFVSAIGQGTTFYVRLPCLNRM